MGKTIRGDILVRKGPPMGSMSNDVDWEALYEQYERAHQTRHISAGIASRIVKAATALADSGYRGPVAVVDLMTAKAEIEAGAGAVRLLYVSESGAAAIVTDPRGEIAEAQANKQRQKSQPYSGGLFNR